MIRKSKKVDMGQEAEILNLKSKITLLDTKNRSLLFMLENRVKDIENLNSDIIKRDNIIKYLRDELSEVTRFYYDIQYQHWLITQNPIVKFLIWIRWIK